MFVFAQGNALGHAPQNTPSPEPDRRGDRTIFPTADSGRTPDCMEGRRPATLWPENPTARLPTATGRAASRTGPRPTGTGSTTDYTGSGKTGTGLVPTCIGSGSTCIGSGPSYIGSASSYIGSGSSYIGSASTYIGSGPSYIGSGSSYIGFGSTYIGSASSYIGFGKTGMLSRLRCAVPSRLQAVHLQSVIGLRPALGSNAHPPNLSLKASTISPATTPKPAWHATSPIPASFSPRQTTPPG